MLKSPRARRRGRHGIDRRDAAALLDAGVIGEEERAIVPVVHAGNDQRAAERAAELVAIERRHRILEERAVGLRRLADEEVARVERVVAQELERGAAQLIGAGLGGHGHDAGAASELRGEHAREHLELADLLDRRRDDHGVERELVVVDAVDEPAVRVRLMAERVEVGRAARVERAGAGQVLVRLPRRDARHEIDERREVAAVERQLLDRRLLDDRADLGRIACARPARWPGPSSSPRVRRLRAPRRCAGDRSPAARGRCAASVLNPCSPTWTS